MPRTVHFFLQGDALALPFGDATFDAATVGYGLRNVADIPLALRELRRVLKPGEDCPTRDGACGRPQQRVHRNHAFERFALHTSHPIINTWKPPLCMGSGSKPDEPDIHVNAECV